MYYLIFIDYLFAISMISFAENKNVSFDKILKECVELFCFCPHLSTSKLLKM